LIVGDVRDPDVAVGPFVDPVAVLVELFFVFSDFRGEVLPFAPGRKLGVAAAVPFVERVVAGIAVFRLAEEPAVGGRHGLLGLDEDGAFFGRGLEAAFTNENLGLSLEPDIEPVQPFLENVKRGVGGVDLDALFRGQGAHPEIGAAFREMDIDALIAFRGQDGEFDFSVVAETEIVAAAEMDLSLTALGPHLVSLNEGKIDLSLFIAQVRCPLDTDRAVDVAQAGKTVRIIPLVLGREAQGDRNDECERQKRCLCHHLVHRLSPSDPNL
jgi:hypothetical protein